MTIPDSGRPQPVTIQNRVVVVPRSVAHALENSDLMHDLGCDEVGCDPFAGKVCLTCGGAIGPPQPPTRYQEAGRKLAIKDIMDLAQSVRVFPWPDPFEVEAKIKAIIEENWRR